MIWCCMTVLKEKKLRVTDLTMLIMYSRGEYCDLYVILRLAHDMLYISTFSTSAPCGD